MNDTQPITIPSDLLPDDGRFGSGPSRIPNEAMVDLAATGVSVVGTSHRRPAVKDLIADIRTGLTDLYGLPDGYDVVLGVGGATAFWDVTAFSLIEERSAHFTCGEFSSKFADVSTGAPHLGTPIRIEADAGSAPEPRPVDDVDTVAFIHNETSTGVMARFARLSDALVVVDATSAAGAVPVDAAEFDVYYFSPQKALASEGGLWVALTSPAAIERARSIADSGRWIPPFLSFTTAIDNSLKDQTYNTPSVATLWLLRRQIDQLRTRGGLGWAFARATASSNLLYEWAESSPFATPFVQKEHRSPTVVTIDLDPATNAEVLCGHLRSNGIVDIESYRKLGRNQIRVATFPTIPTEDVRALTACIDFTIERM